MEQEKPNCCQNWKDKQEKGKNVIEKKMEKKSKMLLTTNER